MADAADGRAHISPGDLLGAEVARGSDLGRRVDDTLAVSQYRLAVNDSETAPLVDYYRGCGILLELSADRPDRTSARICGTGSKSAGWRSSSGSCSGTALTSGTSASRRRNGS